jgi:hypothetical protein
MKVTAIRTGHRGHLAEAEVRDTSVSSEGVLESKLSR